MTIGIYAIYWENPDLIYIGQSQNIESRFTAHRSLLTRGHYNYKLRKAYSLYGEPTFIILDTCSISELNTLEVYYIDEFDSLKNGLNINSGGDQDILGYTSGKCKNSKEELITGFLLLLDPSKSIKEISKLTGVSYNVLSSIKYGQRHHWLKEEFPDEYAFLRELIKSGEYQSNSQEKRYKVKATVISPGGIEYEITNGKKFAEEHSLNIQHFNAVVRGAEKQHKGWTLKRKEG